MNYQILFIMCYSFFKEKINEIEKKNYQNMSKIIEVMSN